ncbi:MAG: peptidylprolyl isomerase [Myxococcota bacterium]
MIAVALLAVVGCDEAPTQATPVVIDEPGLIADLGEPFMTVNGFQVGRNEIDVVFKNKGVPAAMLDSVVKSPGGYHIIEEYALATALYRQAVEEKLFEDPQTQLELAFAQRQALSRAMQRTLAQRALTDERVNAWIEDNRDQFALPQKQARQIVVGSESYAEDLMTRLEGGEEFADLARDHSIDMRTAPNGGYLGWFSMQDRPELGRALFAHSKEAVIGPLETPTGWHIVEILGSRDATPAEEQQLIARAALEQKAAMDAMKDMRDSLEVNMQFVGAPENGHLPEGHPPAEGAAEEPAAAADEGGEEAPAANGAGEN